MPSKAESTDVEIEMVSMVGTLSGDGAASGNMHADTSMGDRAQKVSVEPYIHPSRLVFGDSPWRSTWTILLVVTLFYNVIINPIQIFYLADVGYTILGRGYTAFTVLDYLCDVVFLIDICLRWYFVFIPVTKSTWEVNKKVDSDYVKYPWSWRFGQTLLPLCH